MSKKVKKAEYPLNSLGFGYRSTLENGPYLFTEVEYLDPQDNYRDVFCGACPFFNSNGLCVALNNNVSILGSCKLYISMEHELYLRHEAFIRQYHIAQGNPTTETEVATKSDELEILQQVEKRIVERDGEYCIISHKTGKDLGCYSSHEKAEAALERMKRFRKDLTVKIAARDDEKQIVYGEVLIPDSVDSQGDTITVEEIEKAAHKYALTPMIIGEGHLKEAKARPVETFIHNPEIMKNVKPGSWLMAIKISDDELWRMVKEGEMTGLSIGAVAKRISVDDSLDQPLEEEQ